MEINITPSPDFKEVFSAFKVMKSWLLHYYQLMYSQKLAAAGRKDLPFSIELEVEHCPRLKVISNKDAQYSFEIGWAKEMSQDEYDKVILSKCAAIQEAIASGKQKRSRYACCPLAVPQHCVCNFRGDCVVHGAQCNGSHD